MSHEIRTPISGIIGLCEHLLDCGLSEEQLEFASSILESAKFLLTIINDVLDFSKIESGHMDVESIPFSPYKLISDVVIPLRLQAKEKGLALTSNCDLQADIVLLGDAWRMRQILTNLVGNALKFTTEGHVELTVRTIEHDKPGFMVVQFTVRDSGVGIDKEVMKGLFKPFHQADSSTARLHGGTGLGLVICRQVSSHVRDLGEPGTDRSPASRAHGWNHRTRFGARGRYHSNM
jgi:signal transduction histidine kinase